MRHLLMGNVGYLSLDEFNEDKTQVGIRTKREADAGRARQAGSGDRKIFRYLIHPLHYLKQKGQTLCAWKLVFELCSSPKLILYTGEQYTAIELKNISSDFIFVLLLEGYIHMIILIL